MLHVLVPFGVIASTSFQPDPLMVASCCLAICCIVHDDETACWKSLALAAAAIGLGGLRETGRPAGRVAVRLRARGYRVPGEAAQRSRGHRAARPSSSLRLAAPHPAGAPSRSPRITCTAMYVTGKLVGQSAGRFYPGLWTTSFFWQGWWGLAVHAVGLIAIVAAVVGHAGRDAARFVESWSACGSVTRSLCFTFAYHAASHDYYHLPLIPIASLAVGALVDRRVAGVPGPGPGPAGRRPSLPPPA